MKKYTVKVVIQPPIKTQYETSVQSDTTPKTVNEGVMKIGEVYFNSINVCEYVLVENGGMQSSPIVM